MFANGWERITGLWNESHCPGFKSSISIAQESRKEKYLNEQNVKMGVTGAIIMGGVSSLFTRAKKYRTTPLHGDFQRSKYETGTCVNFGWKVCLNNCQTASKLSIQSWSSRVSFFFFGLLPESFCHPPKKSHLATQRMRKSIFNGHSSQFSEQPTPNPIEIVVDSQNFDPAHFPVLISRTFFSADS